MQQGLSSTGSYGTALVTKHPHLVSLTVDTSYPPAVSRIVDTSYPPATTMADKMQNYPAEHQQALPAAALGQAEAP